MHKRLNKDAHQDDWGAAGKVFNMANFLTALGKEAQELTDTININKITAVPWDKLYFHELGFFKYIPICCFVNMGQ